MAAKIRIGTAFTGGGVCLNRLDPARYEIAWGIEYDAKKADVYRLNTPCSQMIVSRIQDVDPSQLPDVDLFQASPECKEFPTANKDGQEGPEQLSQAEAICNILRVKQPHYFALENVRGYFHSKSFRMIRDCLNELGYWDDAQVLNSANFSVPQTRERLILRAVQGALVPHLPQPTRWIGWYEAIEDLIPSLPETTFAPWQLARLADFDLQDTTFVSSCDATKRTANQPAVTVVSSIGDHTLMPKAFIMRSQNNKSEWGDQVRYINRPAMTVTTDKLPKAFLAGKNNDKFGDGINYLDEPAMTVPANSQGQFKAFVVDGQTNDNGRAITLRQGDCPMYTVSASIDQRPAKAWLSQGRVVKMTPRCLARFMSLLDTYQLPANNRLACEIIGNGFPSEMARRIFDNLTGQED